MVVGKPFESCELVPTRVVYFTYSNGPQFLELCVHLLMIGRSMYRFENEKLEVHVHSHPLLISESGVNSFVCRGPYFVLTAPSPENPLRGNQFITLMDHERNFILQPERFGHIEYFLGALSPLR